MSEENDHLSYCGLCGSAVLDWTAHKNWHVAEHDLLRQMSEAIDKQFNAIRYVLTGVK